MQGYWLYLAVAALSASSVGLRVHLGLTIIFHLFSLRVILTKKRKLISWTLLTYLAFLFLSMWNYHSHLKTGFHVDQKKFHFTFQNKPMVDGNKLSGIVRADSMEDLALTYKIMSKDEKTTLEKLKSGITCTASGELTKPEPNRNEHLFNYEQYLFWQNIHWQLKIDHFENCIDDGKGILVKLKRMREAALEKIEQQYPDAIIPYAKALLFGDRFDFEDKDYSLYQRLGIVHLLAISGLHISLIYMGFFYILIRTGVTRETGYKFIIFFLPIYAILCGANPPVIRASIMLIIILLSSHSKLSLTSIDGLSISFLLFMMINPFILFHIGFQLSFIVSLSILLSSQTILSRYKNGVKQLLLISFISQISSLPIIVYHFYQISIVSILSNLFFVPLYSFVLLPLLIFTFLISFLFPWLFEMVNKCLLMIIYFSEKVAQLFDFKWGVLIVGRPGIWVLIFIIVAAIYFFICFEKGRNMYLSAILLMVIVCFNLIYRFFSPYGEINFIDIGQGDSILIQLPYHQGTYLIDTGGSLVFDEAEWAQRKHPFSIGNDILIPFLKAKGIWKIDKLILTHSDADHIGAAKELAGQIKVDHIYISPNSWRKPLMYEIIKSFQNENTPISEVKDGFGWETNGGSFRIISPFDDHYEGNNDSLVLYGNIGGRSWLFTGDLEKEGEEELIKSYSFHVDVLKIGHHGSKTSTSPLFLDHVQPAIAVISVGKNNRYGHPNNEVLERLNEKNIIIYRTDSQGEVMYKFKGNKGTFHTVLP
ncbi:DNA internalization-related competence protein ComEC/Rec2 [Bacillus sp. FJAT-49736]|uniref:DNA internalization-related competence protein ComEC/Rec2 n=1 Tax=Bacillus sp. FJAT-49736 TaxID=2833582 RepID=UPI001BC9AC6A|nr:DNA internalization-related competence protein ComEC/Rec2 [Bacillus sp. FJAT-49736]MBS4173601.1 DNA internalization-related competence protein ComEC/Rec2 [Bacillus sp. FJAT-49736]